MYATSDNHVWTARDERELKAEHKRVTRATMKHLGKLPTEQDRTLLDKLFRRQTADADLPPHKRPLPPKAPSDKHWWSRSSDKTTPRTPTYGDRLEVRRAATVSGHTRTPPPVPPRYDLLQTVPPDRPRRKSEEGSAARRRARETALRHLETDRGFGRYVRENRDYVPPPLKPGTWMPGQLNAVRSDDSDYDFIDEYGATTPQLYKRFPLPPTIPLNVDSYRRGQSSNNIPIPPVPPMPDQSNRESFLELRKKRSYRV
ncbi:hypothetical protein RhiJN_17232 [Ceratobasidium sp. AG-Ba]|nr:hypothetical protein RhiJN_17232 [Ceratobasidium sp. AG-Ba]